MGGGERGPLGALPEPVLRRCHSRAFWLPLLADLEELLATLRGEEAVLGVPSRAAKACMMDVGRALGEGGW